MSEKSGLTKDLNIQVEYLLGNLAWVFVKM